MASFAGCQAQDGDLVACVGVFGEDHAGRQFLVGRVGTNRQDSASFTHGYIIDFSQQVGASLWFNLNVPKWSLRNLRLGDVPNLIEAWNVCLECDQFTVDRFENLFLNDPNFDLNGAFVVEFEGRIAGCMIGVRRIQAEEVGDSQFGIGWITAFFVAPEFRRFGIGSELLMQCERFLLSVGCTKICCNGYAPYYVAPGVDARYEPAVGFLESRGYQVFTEPVAMGMSLVGVETPDRVREISAELAGDGVEVTWLEDQYEAGLLQFLRTEFPYWYSSVKVALECGRKDILIAVKGDEVVGFTQWENPLTDPPNGAAGRFGPFGVKADMRNRGIGAVIFYRLVEEVQLKGATRLWFGWAGPRNLTFYERAGCVVERQFKMFSKSVS